jgi:hypothetical protein
VPPWRAICNGRCCTASRGIWPTARGVHAVSFNAQSWGLECVGDFDREKFDGAVRDKYVEGLACLTIATGFQLAPFERGVRGLHFHRDDPKTTKTCPGKGVDKAALIKLVQAKVLAMSGGDHPAEQVNTSPVKEGKTGTVNTDGLNVRADASARSPSLASLAVGKKLAIVGQARNGETLWYQVQPLVDGRIANVEKGWVSARYVTLN